MGIITKLLGPSLRSRVHRRRATRAAAGWAGLEALESRTLLSFSNASLEGIWSLAATLARGDISFDGQGVIDGGQLHHAGGSDSQILGDTYDVTSEGGVSLVLSDDADLSGAHLTGGINNTGDVVALTPADGQSLKLTMLLKGGSEMSDATLKGTWSFVSRFVRGTIRLDGHGKVKGHFTSLDGSGAFRSGSSYAVEPDGATTFSLRVPQRGGPVQTLTFEGQVNASTDVMTLTPTGGPTSDTGVIIAVKQAHRSRRRDLVGAIHLATDIVQGELNFDGAGHVTGSVAGPDDTGSAVTGKYSIADHGNVKMALDIDMNGQPEHLKLVGGINTSKNVVALATKKPVGNVGEQEFHLLALIV